MAKLIVDFTDVESGGGRVRVPEGDYRVSVASVKQETAKSGNEMLVWEFEFEGGKAKGKSIRDYTVLQPNALWKLKQLLEALGIDVPSKRIDFIPLMKKLKGKELGITVVDEEYENKISSKVSDYIDLETLSDFDAGDDDEDEAPKAKKKTKKKKSEEDDEIEEIDLDEL
jgi:hypothetical protein